MKKVICVETGIIYESMVAAAASIRSDKRNIWQAINNGHKCGGYHWEYYDGEEEGLDKRKAELNWIMANYKNPEIS